MEAASTGPKLSPLAELLRMRVARVLAGWEAGGASTGTEAGRWALRRFLDALDELAAAADALTAPQREPRSRELARVLLATDDAHLASEMQHALGPHVRVDVATTPNLALRHATAHTPAVLFASGASALECARRVRELLPGLPAVIGAAEPELSRLVAELGSDDPAVLVPTTVGTGGLAMAIRALLPARPEAARPAEEPSVEPRSYAHLAGLLPRALARTIQFDVGAAVIARPAAEPLVDVHTTSECGDAALDSVRERALALFRMVSGRPQKEDEASQHPAAPAPFRSSIYVPLATEGRVVGLTYLASLRPDAFSEQDERVLADLAAHASGAYRQLEASVRHLRLTPRQSQVLALIASGLSDKEVATRLGLAHRTVRTHVDRLLREHGLHSRTEAVAAWLRGKQG